MGLTGATYVSTRVVLIRDPGRTCGISDYRRVLRDYSALEFIRRDDAADAGYSGRNLDLDSDPDFMKFKAWEFGEALKDELACLMRSGTPESMTLIRTIDHFVNTYQLRLDATKMRRLQ